MCAPRTSVPSGERRMGSIASILPSHPCTLWGCRYRGFHTTSRWSLPPPSPKGGATVSYQCGECSKSFRLLNALNHHILTKHAGNAKAMMMKDGKLVPVEVAAPAASPTVTATPAPNRTPTAPVGMAFPGMPLGAAPFGGVGGSMSPVGASTGTAPGAHNGDTEPGEEVSTDDKKSAFVCTICQKTFRLEAALQHHYQAKHNMKAPSSVAPTSASTAEKGAGGEAATRGVADDATTKAPASVAEYVRQQEGELPSAPQYHLDVAPNAPEESEIAVHWRCVNHCVLMGQISDISVGYVFEDQVLQFTLATNFEAPSPGDPDKDFHLVRVYDESFWKPLKDQLRDGDVVMVDGRLRLVPQYDAVLRKYYHHPVVQVFPGSGFAIRTH